MVTLDRTACEAVANAAYAMEGTPFQHTGRNPGTNGGIDCVGLLVETFDTVGVTLTDNLLYPPQGDATLLDASLAAEFTAVTALDTEIGPGVVARINYGRSGAHVGIIGFNGDLIHSIQRYGTVIATVSGYEDRIIAYYVHPFCVI